jgi:predicted metalloprotease with PDZ domain
MHLPWAFHRALPRLRGAFVLMSFAAGLAVTMPAPVRATIRYEVSLARPAQHFFHVGMTIPAVQGSVLIQMPAWNALYEIRDFGYHVNDLRAADKARNPLRVTRIDKETWRIDGNGEVRVEYATFWDEPGPFGTQLNQEHAFLNFAMVLCYVVDRRNEDAVVRFGDVPSSWRIAIELPQASGRGDAPAYAAPSYDALVDAPAEISQFDELSFRAAGRPIRVIIHGEALDHNWITRTLSQIVEYQTRLMGDAPFPEYMFLYHVGREYGGGGMEHADCTAISVSSAAMLANVSAHEFFHLWNVKRIRPQSLEPVDYTHEMWTPALWFAEGVTSTYAAYTLVRTGIWSKAQFLADLGDQITELEARPAHRWQSAEESSLDTWLEKYPLYERPDFSISYYNKGQLLGVALDIAIRDATDNRASLDDVLRRLNQEYARRGRLYADSAGIRAVAEEVVRAAKPDSTLDAGDFFTRYVRGTDEIPFQQLLGRAGLALKAQGERHAALGFEVSRDPRGAPVVANLDLASPAARAGIREGDILASIDGGEVPRNLERSIRGRSPGELLRVRIRRGVVEDDISFALGQQSTQVYVVEETAQVTEKQRRIRNGLLQGSTDGP